MIQRSTEFIDINSFSKYHSFPVSQLLIYKAYPRINVFNYKKHEFYIYCYIDPFESYYENNELLKVNRENETPLFFAYEPFYIGKASSMTGYRMNQHINNFMKPDSNADSKLKTEKFKKIQEQFSKKIPGTPHNWKEYKDTCILVLEDFESEEALLKREMELINSIGTIGSKKGPLVNKIQSYKQEIFKNKTF